MADATHRVVFELSTDAPASWNALLNNLENLQAAFGPEVTELEVVAHGPGIAFMLAAEERAGRMAALAERGVVFAACHNAIRSRHIDPARLWPFARIVPAGVAEVVLKQEAGWAYLKSGI